MRHHVRAPKERCRDPATHLRVLPNLQEHRRVHTCGWVVRGGCLVTVRVTTLKGAGAGRYYTEHLPSYYLDGDEPPGRWFG